MGSLLVQPLTKKRGQDALPNQRRSYGIESSLLKEQSRGICRETKTRGFGNGERRDRRDQRDGREKKEKNLNCQAPKKNEHDLKGEPQKNESQF